MIFGGGGGGAMLLSCSVVLMKINHIMNDQNISVENMVSSASRFRLGHRLSFQLDK